MENIDISKEIEITSKPEGVSSEIAQKEERIAKAVSEIPSTTDELAERKKKIVSFLSKNTERIYYLILGFIVLLSVYIRTRNISKLKDITTGTWTLGPDLDPFLFLRWAQEIVKNGSLFAFDFMRNVPIGFETSREAALLSYMISWLYNFMSFFSKEVTVTYAAIIFPVVMAGLTAIAFFLFARKIFYKENVKTKNIIALIATGFFVLTPSLLPRTIAGIPEKESAAFFFMFLAFYFFLEAITSEKFKKGLMFGFLAGVSTALMAQVWGGFIFIFFTIPPVVLLAFLLGKIDVKKFSIYALWLITSFAFMTPFSLRYSIESLITSTSTGSAIGILFLMGISLVIMNNKKLRSLRNKIKLPKQLSSFILSLALLLIIIVIFMGPGFLYGQAIQVKDSLIVPITDRFSMTVAENKQPYFANDWKSSFGPVKFGIPLYFWLFFIGAVVLFNGLIKSLSKRERIILTFGYFVFLLFLIFSRYSQNSILDGISGLSLLVYFGGWIFFLGSCGHVYYKRYKSNNFEIFRDFNFSYILYFLILTLGIIGARGGIRLIMVLGAISPVVVSFLIVKTYQKYFEEKEETMKFFIGILAILIMISAVFTMWAYYQSDKATAENFAPGAYQWQWQKAMSWVRENTAENAVFAHWWDYGYWLQSIGERATILDGGNARGYWNHLLGRYVLTGTSERDSLEFLYAHNGTHLLIDSTEIGKYTAYSSIGSDKDYDRFSWIQTYLMDEAQTRETNNQTIYIYAGGTVTDEDILWEEGDTKIFLPKKKAAVGAWILTRNGGNFSQPKAVFVYNNQQYTIPIRYLYINKELHDFGSGLEAGVFTFPKLNNVANGQVSINPIGASMYFSQRTVNSQLVKLYLFDQDSKYFKLAHSEESLIVENLKQQIGDFGEFLYYNGFNGPIKIWEITYPSDIEFKSEYIETEYPLELRISNDGEYR